MSLCVFVLQKEPAVADLWQFSVFYVTYTLELSLFVCSLFADVSALPWLHHGGHRTQEKQPLLGKSPDEKKYSLKQVNTTILVQYLLNEAHNIYCHNLFFYFNRFPLFYPL